MSIPSYSLPPPPPPNFSPATGVEPPKPVGAVVLSLLAGVLILLGGAVEVVFLVSIFPNPGGPCIGSPGCPPGPTGPALFGFVFAFFGALSIVLGSLIIALAAYLYSEPRHHVVLGILIAVFSVVSATGFAGFGIGLILGLIGGILAAVWKPWPVQFPMTPPVSMWSHRVCMKCGRMVSVEARFCPFCGNSLI